VNSKTWQYVDISTARTLKEEAILIEIYIEIGQVQQIAKWRHIHHFDVRMTFNTTFPSRRSEIKNITIYSGLT
jgi:hypothetical protein